MRERGLRVKGDGGWGKPRSNSEYRTKGRDAEMGATRFPNGGKL